MEKKLSTTTYNLLLAVAITAGAGLFELLALTLIGDKITWTGSYTFLACCFLFVFLLLQSISQEKKITELEAKIKLLEEEK